MANKIEIQDETLYLDDAEVIAQILKTQSERKTSETLNELTTRFVRVFSYVGRLHNARWTYQHLLRDLEEKVLKYKEEAKELDKLRQENKALAEENDILTKEVYALEQRI